MKKLSKGQEFLLSLERERFNVAHRKTEPERVIVRVPVKCGKRHTSDARDRAMYHAGRYAAGARDKAAIEADAWLQKALKITN